MTRQSIQRDKIFSFKTKGSTFATEQNNILISPISSFEILKIGKLSGIFSLNPHWGSNRPCPWSSFLRSDEKVTGHSYLQHFTAPAYLIITRLCRCYCLCDQRANSEESQRLWNGSWVSKLCEIFVAESFNKSHGSEIFLFLLKQAFKIKIL